jgi:hypothetical protein
MSQKTLATLHKRLRPLAIRKMPLVAPPSRDTRFGRPLELAKVHWLRPDLVHRFHETDLLWRIHLVFAGLYAAFLIRETRFEDHDGAATSD